MIPVKFKILSRPVFSSNRSIRRASLGRFFTDFGESKLALAGLLVFAVIVVLAVGAPLVTPQDPYDLAQLSILDGQLAPGTQGGAGHVYWLGTDDQGRDMLSAILHGVRISLFVGVVSGVIALLVGMVMGLLAAFYGGVVDTRHVVFYVSLTLLFLFLTEQALASRRWK